MSVITFDAIKYVDRLVAKGVDEPQAKEQIIILQEALDETLKGELVTKSDLKDLELRQEKRFIRLEILMSIMLVILVIPVLRDLFG